MGRKSKVPFTLVFIQWLFPKVEALSVRLAARWFRHLFFTPVRYARPQKEQDALRQAKEYSLVVDDTKIHVYTWGTGTPVLFVHGWAGRGTQFRKFVEPFNAAGLKVVALDGPAHGKSDGKSTEIRAFANAIKAVYEHEKAVAIISHSFGGVASLYSIASGLTNLVQINIASPSIGDEIINTFLRALKGSARIGELFKEYVFRATGQHFDDFSALRIIHRVPGNLNLLLVYDEHDVEVIPEHALRLKQEFPAAVLFQTKELGHNRILKDDRVINRCVTFIQQRASLGH
jgi:hypothetical protein